MEWDLEDQEKMIVWMMDQKLKCADCGTRQEEWDPKKGGVMHAYHVSRYTCLMCKNIEDTYEDVRKKSNKGKLPNGFKVRLVPHYIWKQRAKVRKQLEVQRTIDAGEEQAAKRAERQRSIADQ